MSDPELMTPIVERWLRDSTPTPPDAERSVDEVMTTLLQESQVRPRPTTRFLPWRSRPDRGFSVFTFMKVAAATVVVALFGMFLLSGALTDRPGDEVVPAADSPSPSAEVLFDAVLPTELLPSEFTKVVADQWTFAAGSDSRLSLANEGYRGCGVVIETGELLVEPAIDALIWSGAAVEPTVAPAGEAVTLVAGDAIYLPAMAADAVDPRRRYGWPIPEAMISGRSSFTRTTMKACSLGIPTG